MESARLSLLRPAPEGPDSPAECDGAYAGRVRARPRPHSDPLFRAILSSRNSLLWTDGWRLFFYMCFIIFQFVFSKWAGLDFADFFILKIFFEKLKDSLCNIFFVHFLSDTCANFVFEFARLLSFFI